MSALEQGIDASGRKKRRGTDREQGTGAKYWRQPGDCSPESSAQRRAAGLFGGAVVVSAQPTVAAKQSLHQMAQWRVSGTENQRRRTIDGPVVHGPVGEYQLGQDVAHGQQLVIGNPARCVAISSRLPARQYLPRRRETRLGSPTG